MNLTCDRDMTFGGPKRRILHAEWDPFQIDISKSQNVTTLGDKVFKKVIKLK